jgi:porin
MIQAASRTPLIGGGGVNTFMNTGLAAPISGVTPPYLLGGSLSYRTESVNYNFFVYDPRNANTSDVLENPFDDGVTFSLSTNIPITLSGLDGFQNLRGVYSTQKAIDARDLPQLGLPPELRQETRRRGPHWYFAYSFQQFLFQDEHNRNRGWGLFGEWGLSDGNPNPLKYHIILGMGGDSPIQDRSLDRWGLAYFRYHASNSFQNAANEDLGIGIDNEEGFEAFYNLAVFPWLRISADIQVVDPFYSDNDESVFTGIRTQVIF